MKKTSKREGNTPRSSPGPGWMKSSRRDCSMTPATVLAENGIEIPEGMIVKVVEQKENEIRILLPPKPVDLPLGVMELGERIQANSAFALWID